MPVSSSTSAVLSRPRRFRERDRDNRHNCTARRSKEHSRVASDRSSPPEPQVGQVPVYSLPNTTLDQLPPLPLSGATSPSSSTSPVLRSNKPYLKQTQIQRLPQIIHTPAALQPYLQHDDDDDEEDDSADPMESESQISGLPSVITQLRGRRPSHPLSESECVPETGPSGQAVSDLSASCPALPTATQHNAVTSQPQTSPSTYNPALYPPGTGYSPATHSISPSLSTQHLYPGNQYYVPRYPPTPQFAMTQPNTRVGEYYQMPPQRMPFYPGHGYPNRHHIPLGVFNNPNYQRQAQRVPNQGFPPSTNTTQGNRELGMVGDSQSSNEEEDEAFELLSRIQSAIPDLQLLMHRYREATSQLGIQEKLIHQKELQASETLRQNESHVDRLMNEMDFQAQNHSTEISKLRLEIGNLEEKHKELVNAVAVSENVRAELAAACEALKEQIDEDLYRNNRTLYEDAEAQTNSDEAKSTMITWHRRESASLQEKWLQEKVDLEAHHSRTVKELEAALESCRLELENARQREREGEEKWRGERLALQQELEDHKKTLYDELEEERRCLLKRHEKSLEELRKNRRAARRDSYDRVEEENDRLRQQVEALRLGWDADKTKLGKVKDENERQRKLIEAFGEVTSELKSRGDTFFKDAFQELRMEIRGFAHKYCRGGPRRPLPNYVLSKLPVDLPDFTSDTPVSITILANYVQHLISSILNTQIFQPFIFTLSRRHEPVNEYFDDVSHQLRRKSTRREAHWRQHTLYAVYTAPDAKRAVNKVAADITKNICDELRYLISFEDEEQMHAAVRRIVKIAAETWRYARLEKDVIVASMSPEQHPSFFNKDHDSAGNVSTSNNGTDYILPILPAIFREAKRKEGRSSGHDGGTSCIYLHGAILSKNSPAILTRQAEILEASTQQTSFSDLREDTHVEGNQAMPREDIEGVEHQTRETSTPIPGERSSVAGQHQGFYSPDIRGNQSQSDLRSDLSSPNHRRSSTATSATEAGVPEWGGSSWRHPADTGSVRFDAC